MSIITNNMFKMKFKQTHHLLSAFMIVWAQSEILVTCNPISYDPNAATSMTAVPTIPFAPVMMLEPQYDQFAPMPATFPYIFNTPFGHTSFDSNRRSLPVVLKSNGKKPSKPNNNPMDDDEQRALGDLPVSFIEPEGPSTITERISDSFSALGEGFRNHFRSMTENFSDTIDDLKDAWRSSDSKKRG